LKAKTKNATAVAKQVVLEGFFPAFVKYLKDVEGDKEILTSWKEKLTVLDQHLSNIDGAFLCMGDQFTLLNCQMVPQLLSFPNGH
jgi:glutathione S-transferase